ncbi:MAG: long-chain-acyl-CoA synthetase [Deltaproteobacteria bacterium]|nr:long-chain-acyl-CoA synthetase [Deltaproteobacteria bacterium]
MPMKDDIWKKIDEDTLTVSDIPAYYELYCEIAHTSTEIQEDIKDWNANIYFECGDNADHWLKIQDGTLHFGQGKISNPDVTYQMPEDAALRLLSGESDTLFEIYGGNLSISGNPPDTDNFGWIDEHIKGEIRRQLNRKKTDAIPGNTYTLSKEDYLKLTAAIRLALAEPPQDSQAYPEMWGEDDSIGLRMEHRAQQNPDKIALLYEDVTFTNKELNEWINRYANYFLNEVELKKGDVAVVFVENRPEILFAIFGMAKIGVISSLINTRQRENPLIHSIKHSEAKAFLIGEELVDAFEEVKSRLELTEKQQSMLFFITDKNEKEMPKDYINLNEAIKDVDTHNPPTTKDISVMDPYSYIFTSGTTGLPKAAIITNLHTIGSAFYWGKEVVKMTPDDTVYITTPLFHSNAINIGLAAALGGDSAMAIRRKFSASNFWKDARKFNATFFNYVGEICRYLYNQPPRDDDADNPIVKCAGNGIKNEFWMDFKKRFGIERIIEQYGATEMGIPNFANRFNLDCTVGITFSEYSIVKYDVDRDEPIKDKKTGCMIKVDPGEAGLLLGKIDIDTFYMYKDGKASKKKVFRNVFKTDDAWLNTGDLIRDIGFRHAQFVDRLGDTFRWHAENVSTEEVENVVNSFEQVELSCAYGVIIPGTEGRAGMVSIVKKEDEEFNLKGFLNHLKQYLPDYAVPIFTRFQDEFETTATDKVQKVKIKNEGYDRNKLDDPLYVLLPGSSEYTSLTPEIYEEILKGSYRY